MCRDKRLWAGAKRLSHKFLTGNGLFDEILWSNIMKTKAVFLSVLALSGFMFAGSAHAAGECDRYRTSYDQTYCLAKLFLESDNELNSVYKDLNKLIKAPVKQQLVATQRDWIRYRDATCEPSAGTINVDCNYRVNRERTEYLRDRLRECKVGTCRGALIGAASWK